MPLTLQALKTRLWDCAEILRGSAVDRTDWKAYILPLLFFKRICDVWDEETAEAAQLYGDVDPVDFPEVHRFAVPEGCHWRDVRGTPANVGAGLAHAMREIERANPDTLYRVFGAADWGNEHVHVDAIRDDLDTLVLDADLLEAVLGSPDLDKKAKEIEIKVALHLRKRLNDPRFKALGERLEDLKQRHEQGLLLSIDFLKSLLSLAQDVVATELAAEPIVDEMLGKAALTELFEEAKNEKTPIMVERVVNDIDEIVRYVRFDGWQNTHAGEREVKMALRKTLFKYKLHQDQELFDRAYGYVRQYY